MDFQSYAEEYQKIGLNPIPLFGTEKRKLDGWKQYQDVQYDGNFSLAQSLAIVCGKTSDYLTVVDIDVKNSDYANKPIAALLHVFPDWNKLQEKTWIVKTPSNGWHVYFRTPGVTFPTKKYKLSNGLEVEFRCQGAYVMAPPSPASTEKGYPKKHEEYTFLSKTNSIFEVDSSFFDEIKSRLGIDSSRSFTLANIWNGVGEGQRDDGTFSLCMALLDQGSYKPDDVYDSLCEVNKKHIPPMGDSQLKKIFDSAKRTMQKKGKTLGVKSMKKFDPQILVDDLIYGEKQTSDKKLTEKKKSDVTLKWKTIVKLLRPYIHAIITSSTDNFEILCVVSDVDSKVKKTIDLSSRNALLWAIRNLVHLTKPSESFTEAQIDMALNGISSVGNSRNIETIYNRVAMRNDHIYIDMATPDWKILKIGSDGYDIIPFDENCPIFSRFQHQGIISEPVEYMDSNPLEEFAQLLRIKDDDKFIYKILQVAYFLEEYPIPIMLITGEHGSAKSTIEKAIINVVDPTHQNLTTLPKDNQDLILRLYTHYMTGFDNISEMTQQQSDILCTAITGGGTEKRKLFTDKDMAILSFKRKVALNGIAPKIDFSDLRDRAIHIETTPITKKITEKKFYRLFNALLPKVRKQIFELLSESLSIYGEVEAEFENNELELPRMADFTIWGECISRCMGNEPLEFHKMYLKRVKDEKLELATEYPMVDFIDHHLLPGLDQSISIPVTGVIDKLLDEGKFTRQDLQKNQLPETPRGVIPHLTKIASLLREREIKYFVVTETRRNGGICPRNSKYIIFERMTIE